MEKQPEYNEFLEEVRKIKKQLAFINSPLHRFWLGIMTGFGTIIGATILVTIFISILSLLANFGVFVNLNEWLISTLRG